MKKLYVYILNKFIKTFLGLLGIFALVVVSSQLLNLPQAIYRSDVYSFIKAVFLMNFSFFKIELIFAYMISTLLVGYSLRESREIYAIYSMGVSKRQLLVPFVSLTVVFTILALITSMFIVPWANRERSSFFTLSVREHFLESIQKKNFFELSKDIIIYVRDKKENEVDKIFIYNKSAGQAISAEKGIFKGNGLILEDGFVQIPEKDNFNLLKFKSYSMNFNISYTKRYSIRYYENSILLSMIKSKSKDALKALAALSDRISFGIPFVFLGFLGFLMGLYSIREKDYLIGLSIIIVIIYQIQSFYFTKLIEKGSIPPVAFLGILLFYFAGLTYYFYRKVK
jgi:lipopolysaccharide export system permease protein